MEMFPGHIGLARARTQLDQLLEMRDLLLTALNIARERNDDWANALQMLGISLIGSSRTTLRPITTADWKALDRCRVDKEILSRTTTCSVCLDDFLVDVSVVNLPCSHVFHVDCIEQWLSQNRTCPVCRREISDLRKEAQTEPSQDESVSVPSTSSSPSQPLTRVPSPPPTPPPILHRVSSVPRRRPPTPYYPREEDVPPFPVPVPILRQPRVSRPAQVPRSVVFRPPARVVTGGGRIRPAARPQMSSSPSSVGPLSGSLRPLHAAAHQPRHFTVLQQRRERSQSHA